LVWSGAIEQVWWEGIKIFHNVTEQMSLGGNQDGGGITSKGRQSLTGLYRILMNNIF